MLSLGRISISQLFSFIMNNLYYVINWFQKHGVTIYKEKCLCMMASKVLPTICSWYDSEEKCTRFPIPKINRNRFYVCFSVHIKFSECPENERFLKIFSSIHLKKLTYSPESFSKYSPILLLNSLAMVTNKYQLLANYSNNEI